MSSENHKSAHDVVADTRPVFTTPARPHEIPELLRVLPTDAAILVRSELCGWDGLTTARVSEYVQQLEAIMQRQAEGFFTVNEAAQVLADSRPGIDVMHMNRRIAAATVNGERMARDPGDHMPIRGDVNDWDHVVKVADIDAWLTECGAGYLFPHSAVAALAAPPALDRGRRVKRAALIADNVCRWPTIEGDLKYASSNGLREAARTDEIGWWWEESALEWARPRAKLQGAAATASAASVFHRMKG